MPLETIWRDLISLLSLAGLLVLVISLALMAWALTRK